MIPINKKNLEISKLLINLEFRKVRFRIAFTTNGKRQIRVYVFFSNSLIIHKPKTKEIMHRDVFGNLMKNSLFLHP